jgi:hypothetical protein
MIKKIVPICVTLLTAAITSQAQSGELTGVPLASGPGNGFVTLVGFPTANEQGSGVWNIFNLDFAASDAIILSLNTNDSSGAFSYQVNFNASNNTGNTFDDLLVELQGDTAGLTLSDPFYQTKLTSGEELGDHSLLLSDIDLLAGGVGIGSLVLDIASNQPAQSFSLVFKPVPEPSTALMLLGASACLFRRRCSRLLVG